MRGTEQATVDTATRGAQQSQAKKKKKKKKKKKHLANGGVNDGQRNDRGTKTNQDHDAAAGSRLNAGGNAGLGTAALDRYPRPRQAGVVAQNLVDERDVGGGHVHRVICAETLCNLQARVENVCRWSVW